MWGRFYWGRKGGEVGIVVVFAWVSSEERHLKPYIDLYYSLGWSSLVCHADFLTLFFPEKATSLADSILKELLKEIKTRTLPIVFAAFSGGPKGCMYKVVQLIEGKCGGQLSMDEYRLVGDCLCGQIYDSTPVDFKSDLGTRFVLHPSVLKMSSPPRIVSWMAKAFSSGLDALFINRFEAQRADYWQTLYSSANFGPVTIFASEDDELAPYSVVSNFAQRLQELGTDVNLVKWNSSPHVGHYKYHPDEYRAAVTELLRKAAVVFSNRRQHDGVSDMNNTSNPSPESVYDQHRTAESSNASFRRLAIDSTLATDPSNNYSLPSSMEYHESQAIEQAELFRTQNLPSMDARGVLGQILYDVCVAENIEGWDLKPAAPFNGRHVLRDKHGAFNPVKGILRSRL